MAWGSWATVSTRCIKLNSMSKTPVIPPSFLRSKASSVGQSICMIRIGVSTASPLCVDLPSFNKGTSSR